MERDITDIAYPCSDEMITVCGGKEYRYWSNRLTFWSNLKCDLIDDFLDYIDSWKQAKLPAVNNLINVLILYKPMFNEENF